MTSDTRFDVDLDWKDVLDLADADGVAAFFARLRYNTDVSTKQTPKTLGISEAVARPIERIELIAGDDSFQVYLFELTSVSVMARRNLARAFRNRAGNFLFVMTSDYERIDFVLLDRSVQAEEKEGRQSRAPSVRPRTLTIERRKTPNPLHLRLLRRLTWTESDSFYQFEKLQAAWGLVEWGEEEGLFNNRALFSDYYLKHRLPAEPVWRDDPRAAFDAIRQLFIQANTNYSGKLEAELREELFVPIFDVLGFHAAEKRENPGDFDEPDYLLYADDSGARPLAAALTYPWLRFLDGKDEQRDKETQDENPGAAVVSILENAEVPWVIVTNGKIWRLYSREAHSKATSWYEIDLEDVATQSTKMADPRETIRYFWLLFRRQAFENVTFIREEKEETLPWLDKLLIESEDYAKELGEKLKARIFERVFPSLAKGFISEWEGDVTEEDLARTYRATLTLLYRLLFLLYAEARDLLPVRELRGYYEKSLEKLKKEVADAAGLIDDEVEKSIRKKYKAGSCNLYERLREIFEIVDRGSSDLNVPYYNGGLFLTEPMDDDGSDEAEAARFLRDHRVPDRELALALDLLTRDEDDRTHNRVFIDYKSLGVRHLGSIYEGLLEFRLRIAAQKLAIVRRKGRDVYEPFAKLDESKKAQLQRKGRFIPKGALYLENDKHERKATGSYYTPDHIVEYIVEHAVGPVVEAKLEALRPKLRKAQRERIDRIAFAKSKREKHVSKYEHWEHWSDLIDEVFDIKVLDPAMGSGHFLVEAVDFITDKILDFLNAFPWNPVTAHLRSTRETILKEMDRQEITIDPGRLTDVSLLKRHVLKRCIYGVDLNPMAVELAKVSLWLDCFTLGAPLSFLDHHLRCGNSLVGVKVEEVEEAMEEGQWSLFGTTRFEGLKNGVTAMTHVGELSDISVAQVKESRRRYERASDILKPAKRLLDIWISQWFGNTVTPARRGRAERNPAREFLLDPSSEEWAKDPRKARVPEVFANVAETALDASEKHRFFHWELEFPEVFYRPRPGTVQVVERITGGGFDAVVGNPPYDVLEKERGKDLSPHKYLHKYVRMYPGYAASLGGKLNVYRQFIIRGLSLTQSDGLYCQIIPASFMADVSVVRTRSEVIDNNWLVSVAAFPQKDDPSRRVFREAKLSTCVIQVRRTWKYSGEKRSRIDTYPADHFNDDFVSCEISPEEVRLIDPKALPLPMCGFRELSLALRIHEESIRAADVADITRGEINQTVYRRFITSNPTHRPLLKGVEVRQFGFNDSLSQGQREYFNERMFETEKGAARPALMRIATQRITGVDDSIRLQCALSRNGAYFADSTNSVVPLDPKNTHTILSVLNSSVLNWRFSLTSSNNNVGTKELEVLPYPSDVDEDTETRLVELSEELALMEPSSPDFKVAMRELNQIVADLFGVSKEELDLIHRAT